MLINGGKVFLKGEIKVPGDKSISHRSIIIGSIAEGKTEIQNFLFSEDTLTTIKCFKNMGVNINIKNKNVEVEGVGLKGLKPFKDVLYCGNSGTTMRLISGVLIGQQFSTTLVGDDSLSKRPMGRIIYPLRKMGGNIEGIEDEYPPLKIYPTSRLNGIHYDMPVASAQVKSAILLASLYGEGETSIVEKEFSRDHTERMLKYFGIDLFRRGNVLYIDNKNKLKGQKLYIPGDISSASFFIVGALTLKGSNIVIKDVGLNQSRMGIVHVLEKMGGSIEIFNVKLLNNEPVGDIRVKYSKLKGTQVKGDIVSTLIDEIPILAVAATLAEGKTSIRNAEELKYKESNRLRTMATELKKMGASIEELPDGLMIEGNTTLNPAFLDSYNDHRIAMALSIAALNANGQSHIKGFECVKISFPEFFDTLFEITMQ